MDHRTPRNQYPNDIENPNTELIKSMTKEFEALSPLSSECCIYRVSERLRQVNEKAYTPQVVSIGPLHHGKPSLEPMEEHKTRFLKAYIDRTKTSLEYYITTIKSREAELRCCYAKPLRQNSDELVKIALVDAAFLIEVLLRNHFVEFQDDDGHDRIFKKPWMSQDIWPDLRLLENQLPLFVLEAIFLPERISFPRGIDAREVSITKLLRSFFIREPIHSDPEEKISPSGVAHFVDFLWRLYAPGESGGEEKRKIETLSTPNVTELHHAGVKFRASESKNLFNIKFGGGVLEIPKLIISDETELTIRNLLAFEQSHCERDNYLNDYAVVMDRLINTAKDGIVENRLGDSGEAAMLMNKLGDGATLDRENFYFASVSERLDAHCKTSWHKWKANLRQNYFNTPWAIVSVIAAVLLIVLTVIQAVCSVIQVTPGVKVKPSR